MPGAKAFAFPPLYESEINANLERAGQSIEAARLMLGKAYYDFAASRAYYAAFYAATALLLHRGLTFSTHGSVLSCFHREFVKTGMVEIRLGKSLSRLYELRNVGDYGETRHVTPREAERTVEQAQEFLETIKRLIHPS